MVERAELSRRSLSQARKESGRPRRRLGSRRMSGVTAANRARTAAWAERVGAGKIELSMTHSRELAAAIAVVMEAEA